MIPDYKLYHGAVLAELIDRAKQTVSIQELIEEGRLSSYVINSKVGVYVKHSAARMPPWQFTFSKANALALVQLRARAPRVFVVLVCWLDGMVCLSLEELALVLDTGKSQQAWIRAERRKSEWYSVSGAASGLPYKKPQGLAQLIEALNAV
jgi:hypothetical protein